MDIREFKNTYSKFAPSIIWDWCAKPTAEEIDESLLKFSQMGISKVYIRPSKGLVLPYLSDDYFELIRTAARRGGKYGVGIFICDENSSASGNAGGEIVSVGDYRMRDFIRTDKKNVEKLDEIISEGSFLSVLRDVSRVRASQRAPFSDITNPFVTECFIDAVYNRYMRECKRFIGMEIEGFLTSVNFPNDAVPYSPVALERSGEELSSCAEKLLLEDSSFSEKYYSLISDCVSENFIQILKDKCDENAVSLCVNVDGKKEISRQKQYLKADRISICVNTQEIDIIELKLAQTISDQFDKPLLARLLLPAFAPCSERYNEGAFLASFGADSILYDSVAFSLSDRRKYEKHTVSLSAFAEKSISDRLSRLCFVSASTKSDAKALLLYDSREKKLFSDFAEKLLENGISFHVVEKEIFSQIAKCLGDNIVIGNCRYNTLITMDSSIEIDGFDGQIISIYDDIDFILLKDKNAFEITCDKRVLISRQKNSDDEYIFVTAPLEDTQITAEITSKKLFATDSASGEIYVIPQTDGKVSFTVKAGKTALLIASSDISADIAPPYTDDIEFAPHTEETEVLFALADAEENILPLKNVNACFGRKSFRESVIDDLHKEFYALADGETVKVKYPFFADKEVIGAIKVYIENAYNLEFVQFNGKTLTGFTPSTKDARFSGIDITELVTDGKNTLALEYKKANNYTPDFSSLTPSHFYSYNITSFEPVYLCGDFDAIDGTLSKSDGYESDVTKSGMGFYYGPLTYAVKLPDSDLSGKILSVHGDFDICKVKIGKRTLTFFSETPMLEVFNLDSGSVAEVTIYNTPHNLLRTTKEASIPFGIEKIKLCKFEY